MSKKEVDKIVQKNKSLKQQVNEASANLNKFDHMRKLKEKWRLLCLDKIESLKRSYQHEKELADEIDALKRKKIPQGFWEKVKFLIKNE